MIEHNFYCPCCGAETKMLIKQEEPIQYFKEYCDVCNSSIDSRYVLRDHHISEVKVEFEAA